jgi:hypothetical protein
MDGERSIFIMTPYDKLFLAAYFLAIIIVQCVWQHRLIKAHKPINHLLHGAYYAFTILPMALLFAPFWWQVIVIAVVTRAAWFDFTLNKVRGKPLFYNGNGTTGSLQDRIENRLSLVWVKVLKVVYVIIFFVALILIK